MSFKEYFKRELEAQIQKLPRILSIKDEAPEIKVARISFAYDNYKLWEYLDERGDLLKNCEFEKVSKIEKKILKDIDKNR